MLTRRQLLQSASLLTLSPVVPLFTLRTAQALAPAQDERVLVIIQLDGGNDALNTLIPFTDPEYSRLRPTLKADPREIVKVSANLGLHPALKPLTSLLEAGQLALVPGVGYPNPNRSHFESMAIWHTARFDPEERHGYGWLGRTLDPQAGTSYAIGTAVPGALRGRRSAAVALQRAEEMLLAEARILQPDPRPDPANDLLAFVQRQASDANQAAQQLSAVTGSDNAGPFPATELANRLRLIARMLKSRFSARVFYTLQPGYDTHAGQRYTHAGLLAELAGAVAAFFADLRTARQAERVTLLAFSEFGRTIQENSSAGTDHGTAGVVFLAGPGVRGGVHGTMPNLTDLIQGEPQITTDFRQIYATVLADWLGYQPPEILGGNFTRLPLIQQSA